MKSFFERLSLLHHHCITIILISKTLLLFFLPIAIFECYLQLSTFNTFCLQILY